jgi:MFS family permease
VSRLKLPEFIHEVIDDPRQRGILIAGSMALFAVGLTPRVLSPGLPTAQEALRSQAELQNLFLLLAFVGTATVILGGLVSDLFRHRALLVGGLATMLVAALVAIVFDDGASFYLANFAGVAASGVVLAYGIGSVAVAYDGIPRATALGFVYAAFGAGAAASPAVLTLFPQLLPSDVPGAPSSFTFDTSLAYALTAIAAGVAVWAAYRWIPRIPGTLPASRRLVTAVAVWSLAVLAIISGVVGLGGEGGLLMPLVLILGGAIGLVGVTAWTRRHVHDFGQLHVDRRGLAAVLAVGVAIGFAQAVPLMLLPVVFEYPLRYGTWWAVLAIAPFAIALFLAGPVSGLLIRRFGPRGIMSIGTLAVGVANLLLAIVLGGIVSWVREYYTANPETARAVLDAAHYLLFVMPLILVGAGFVVATTVRTAIVFAITPRGLPASAAAINEASVGLGSRIGIVAATTALAATAVASARTMAERGRPEEVDVLVAEFELTLQSLGTPRFREVYAATLEGAEPVKGAAYSVAYMDGVIAALVLSGVVGLLGAGLAWVLIGRRDPLQAVFDMQDEREREGYVPTGTAVPAPDDGDQEPAATAGGPADPSAMG